MNGREKGRSWGCRWESVGRGEGIDEGDWSAKNLEPRLAESVKKGGLELTFAGASGEAR